MSAEDLTLNIAVNLGRVSRWAQEGKKSRIEQFLVETEVFVKQLENTKMSNRFQKTFNSFNNHFYDFRNRVECSSQWAEETLTWANILSHRAKLA